MNKLKDGEDYEKFVFNIIKDKYISCFLWKDIPTKILDIKYYKNIQDGYGTVLLGGCA
jgi:hypothetical protein